MKAEFVLCNIVENNPSNQDDEYIHTRMLKLMIGAQVVQVFDMNAKSSHLIVGESYWLAIEPHSITSMRCHNSTDHIVIDGMWGEVAGLDWSFATDYVESHTVYAHQSVLVQRKFAIVRLEEGSILFDVNLLKKYCPAIEVGNVISWQAKRYTLLAGKYIEKNQKQ